MSTRSRLRKQNSPRERKRRHFKSVKRFLNRGSMVAALVVMAWALLTILSAIFLFGV